MTADAFDPYHVWLGIPREEQPPNRYRLLAITLFEANADVIVMGTQGRTGLSRLLMGSVAEQVLRRATCPVVTVKSTPAKTSAAGAAPEAAGRAAGVARG